MLDFLIYGDALTGSFRGIPSLVSSAELNADVFKLHIQRSKSYFCNKVKDLQLLAISKLFELNLLTTFSQVKSLCLSTFFFFFWFINLCLTSNSKC